MSATASTDAATRRQVGRASVGQGRVFDFESELGADLTYMPMAVRFKLDQCGIRLSLAEWQRLPEYRRRELLYAPCDHEDTIANYRQLVRSWVKESTGTEPLAIPTASDPPWASSDVPEQLAQAATQMGLSVPSPASWRILSPLERFALLKLSRKEHDHRNLGRALREFGFL